MKRSTLVKAVLVTLFVLLNCPTSQAHKIRIFAWEESGTIKTETKFGSGRSGINAVVTVTNRENNEVLLSGKTDDKGAFSFPIPETAKANRYNLNIVVNSGDGHKGSWFLDAADYLGTGPDTTPPAPLSPDTPKISDNQQPSSSTYVINDQQLSRLIESALEKKLAPIKRSLAEQQEKKPTFQDILGGIGYILGLAGIAAYFKSKTKP